MMHRPPPDAGLPVSFLAMPDNMIKRGTWTDSEVAAELTVGA